MSLEIKFASRYLLSSEDKVAPKKHQKILKKLAPNKYKDVDTGYEISFATAYNRQNAEALEDYKRALGEKPKEQKQKSTRQLQEEVTQRDTKRKDRSQKLDEIKTRKDSFALEMYDNPSDFIEKLRDPNVLQGDEKLVQKVVSLANEYGEWAEENNEETIESLLGLQEVKSRGYSLKKSEEQAKENRKKLKNGEISNLRFNDLEQRRKGRQGELETIKRHEVKQKIFSWKKDLEFPDFSSSETVQKIKEESELKSKEMRDKIDSEENQKKLEDGEISEIISKQEFNDFEKKRKKDLADASIKTV